jgi:transposase
MYQEGRKLDFAGQHVFVGLDVSNRSWTVSIHTQSCEHKTFSQPPRVEALVGYLHRHFPGAQYHCVYEAGYHGFWIHQRLTEQGIECWVVNPADVPTKHKEVDRKTDQVDARKLARSLRSGEIDPLYVPRRSALEDRGLVRMRHHVTKKQTRCKNQIKAWLRFYGMEIPLEYSQGYWSRRFTRWLEERRFERESGQHAFTALLSELQELRKKTADLTKAIRHLASTPCYVHVVKLLVSVPGISVLSAMVFVTEIVDIRRFTNLDRLARFVGLVPGEYSSGGRITSTGLSHRSNRFLRHVLIECAWVAVRHDPALLLTFQTLSHRMPKQQAIIRIARKLLNRIRYVWIHETPYQIERVK